MKFSREYTKLQDRLFTTVRAGVPYYFDGQKTVCESPSETFQVTVLIGIIVILDELPLALLRYDTDMPRASREEIIAQICSLYQRPPNPRGDWSLYLLERMKVPDAPKHQGGKT